MPACKKSYSFDRVFLGLYLTVPQTPKVIWTSRKEIFFTLLTQCSMVTWDVGELVLLMKKTHREERLEWFRAGWSKWSISWKNLWFIVGIIETKVEWNARVAGKSWAGIGSACFGKLMHVRTCWALITLCITLSALLRALHFTPCISFNISCLAR